MSVIDIKSAIKDRLDVKQVSDDPLSYRVSFMGRAIGSISRQYTPIYFDEYWHWSFEDRQLSGDVVSFEAAVEAMRVIFIASVTTVRA